MDRAAKTIELLDHQRVARTGKIQCVGQSGTIDLRAAGFVGEELLTSGLAQGIQLQREVLVGRRNVRVADQHLSRNSIYDGIFRDSYFGNGF